MHLALALSAAVPLLRLCAATLALLLGASSLDQLESNMKACEAAGGDQATPLPPEVVDAIDSAWSGAGAAELRDGAFPYWRSYSKDMPGRETLPPGASYDAAKKK